VAGFRSAGPWAYPGFARHGGGRKRRRPQARPSRAGPARTGESPPDPLCERAWPSETRRRRVSRLVSTPVPDGKRGRRLTPPSRAGPARTGQVATRSLVRASLARETRRRRVSPVRLTRCLTETGTAAGAAFAGEARSHRGGLSPDPLCELACKRNAPQARVPCSVDSVPDGCGGGRRRGLRGRGPLARGESPPDPLCERAWPSETRRRRVSRLVSTPVPDGKRGRRLTRPSRAGPARTQGVATGSVVRASLAKRNTPQARVPPPPCLYPGAGWKRGRPLTRPSRAGPARTGASCHRNGCASLLDQAKRAAGACPLLRLPRCLTETGMAAGAAFAGRARSHRGELPPGPLCELACKRNGPQARVSCSVDSVPGGSGDGRWRGLRGRGPLAGGEPSIEVSAAGRTSCGGTGG
jgi:hypothetical protein